MLIISYFLLSLHFFLLFILCIFGIHRLSMVFRWLRYRKIKAIKPNAFNNKPTITIQIPLYNERFVAERIIHAVAKLDYPQAKLEIQIVDDSTDETIDLVAKNVAHYQLQGINIKHVRRTNRKGFKAGALKAAMESAEGEFIAIFDADFTPYPAILNDSIDYFNTDNIAMIQFAWQHLNREDSRLTETQAMLLDAHFSLEQHVRYASDVLFNFNGTAGIWRKEAIIDAGNWSADTLTEDLDLSYRAQLKGWKLIYLNHVGCPGELPDTMNAFKSQQHRWAKGGIQVMKKMLLKVWRSPLSLKHKIESTFHLSNNLAYFVMLTDTIVFLIPSLLIRNHYHLESFFWIDISLVLLSTGGHLIYFFFGQIALGRSKWQALINIPHVLLLGIQLAFNNARAGIEAILGAESEFIRTPKRGDNKSQQATSLSHHLYQAVTPRGGGFEILLSIIYCLVFIWAVYHELWFMLPFILLLIVGFFSSAINTLKSQHMS